MPRVRTVLPRAADAAAQVLALAGTIYFELKTFFNLAMSSEFIFKDINTLRKIKVWIVMPRLGWKGEGEARLMNHTAYMDIPLPSVSIKKICSLRCLEGASSLHKSSIRWQH
tara:strand:- start:552 stop:887 length:336 start_codon:yes stop_codon:yes gene_type:complete